ncbi:MAG: hypothetical protein U0L76_01680 [Ruminococcus sp.]|nr:hypothetical protein [Ruminococcus sp.]
MKKSSFVALTLGTVSGVLFALGMCMALLPEWNTFTQGIIMGCIGIFLGLVTVLIWRKMEHKAPIKLSGKAVFTTVITLIGTLLFGAGMCLCMVWSQFVVGVIIGLVGIVVLLSLIPLIKGLK